MTEKKNIKISLSTFLLIIAIVIIIIMGFFIYKLYNAQSVSTENISNLNTQINNVKEQLNNSPKETTSLNNDLSDNSLEYQIIDTYCQENAQGDEPSYTFSADNKVTYGALWMCSGTYTINKNTIEINFTSAVDPDGNKANVKDYGVDESVELTIINNNKLKDNFNGVVYSK